MQTHYYNLSLTVVRKNLDNELKKALTHYSYYSNEKEAENTESSKCIFLGMYAFKGRVAELMRKYVPLNGTQLQHYLGNVFKPSQLEKIYQRYNLGRCVRYGQGFIIEKHHHVFVYALLGFVTSYAEEQELLRFIYHNFLSNTEYLMPTKPKRQDLWSQCLFLSKMYYNEVPILDITQNEEGYTAVVWVNQDIIAQQNSKSRQYARKKALKLAVLHIAQQQSLLWSQSPIAQEVERMLKRQEAEKIAKEKNLKLKAYLEKQRKRNEDTQTRKAKRKAEKQEQDIRRRKAKADAKKRKEQDKELQQQKKIDLANLSVSKRRHLQDKGILNKGAPAKKKNKGKK